MLYTKVILALCLQLACVLAVPTGTTTTRRPMQGFEEQWERNKVMALFEKVRDPLKQFPVTLVGWQYIHDDNGNVKEIKTIDLVLESFEKKLPGEYDMLLDVESGDMMETFPYIIDKVHEHLGDQAQLLVAARSWDIDGTLNEMLLIDPFDIITNGEDGDIYMMRNMSMDSLDDAKDFALKHKRASVLVLNPDGTYNEKESAPIPVLHGAITEQTGATQEMLEEAIKALDDGMLMHKENAIKYIAEQMNKNHPEYVWNAVEGHDGSYTSRDVHIGMEYVLVDLHQNSIPVDLFGVQKE